MRFHEHQKVREIFPGECYGRKDYCMSCEPDGYWYTAIEVFLPGEPLRAALSVVIGYNNLVLVALE